MGNRCAFRCPQRCARSAPARYRRWQNFFPKPLWRAFVNTVVPGEVLEKSSAVGDIAPGPIGRIAGDNGTRIGCPRGAHNHSNPLISRHFQPYRPCGGLGGAPALQETLQPPRPVLRRGPYPPRPSRVAGTAWARGVSVYMLAKIDMRSPIRRASIWTRSGGRQ